MSESGKMSFQAVLIYYPRLLVLEGSYKVAAIPHISNTMSKWFVNYYIKNLQLRGHAPSYDQLLK